MLVGRAMLRLPCPIIKGDHCELATREGGNHAQEPSADSSASQAYGIETMHERILVVDDESGITETLSAILRLKGYVVDIATNGEEGYERAIAFKPALVISDISMPRLNGIDMAIKIAAEMPRVRILLFSGQAMTLELLQQARVHGYNFECLVKPFHPLDLINKVQALLGSRGPSLASLPG